MADFLSPTELSEKIRVLEEQVKGLVESQRNDLQGNWDASRIWLDGVDPANKGAWTNVPFPKA